MIRRQFSLAALALALGGTSALADERPAAVLYKNPQCACCEEYAEYLRSFGYPVTVKPTFDLALIKRQNGVPEALDGCHTMLVGGYVVEGHVPVGAIDRLLAEHPDIKGISLPGMPAGSPGMFGDKEGPFTIYAIGAGGSAPTVFATE
jgi:hypothetical protein